MKTIATKCHYIWARGLLLLIFVLVTGCAASRLTDSVAVYDFGPNSAQALPLTTPARGSTLMLSAPQASAALEGSAVLYRLGYADAQQLKPYALARWSAPPAQLIGLRLRQRLSQQRAVVAPGELLQPSQSQSNQPDCAGTALLHLRLELEEFSQLFDSPSSSHALARLRATLTQRSAGSETLLAQRSFTLQHPAPSPDASGGVRALTAAADALVLELETWLAQTEPSRCS